VRIGQLERSGRTAGADEALSAERALLGEDTE